MTGAQNRENIENTNKYIKLAPLPLEGPGELLSTIDFQWFSGFLN
jgi:hypothetical protein